MARYSEAQNKATQKYIASNYGNIMIRVPKGKKEEFKKLAEGKGKSLNQFIVECIEEHIQ